MTRQHSMLRTFSKLAVAASLLIWIFHNIFMQEARVLAVRQGLAWDNLPRPTQWHQAWTHGPGELWHMLQAVNPGAFALSLLLMGSTLLIGAIRWSMALRVQGIELGVRRTGEISIIAHFFNSFLLGSTGGDLLKAYYAARETHHKKTEAVTAVFVDRLVGLFSMLLFAGVAVMLNWGWVSAHDMTEVVALLVMAMLVAGSVLVYLAFWGGLSRRFPKARAWMQRLPKGDLLQRSLDACRHYGRHQSFLLWSMAASMTLNMACVLQFWVLSEGLGMNLPLRSLLVTVPAVICIAAIPITPSGLGVRENLFVLLLTVPAVGASSTQALSLSLLAYSGSLIWSIMGGLVYLLVRDSENLKAIAHDQQAADEP